jgi:hypothetical protein
MPSCKVEVTGLIGRTPVARACSAGAEAIRRSREGWGRRPISLNQSVDRFPTAEGATAGSSKCLRQSHDRSPACVVGGSYRFQAKCLHPLDSFRNDLLVPAREVKPTVDRMERHTGKAALSVKRHWADPRLGKRNALVLATQNGNPVESRSAPMMTPPTL